MIADLEDEALELGDNQVEEDFDLESDDDDDDDIAEGFDDDELEDVKDGKLHYQLTKDIHHLIHYL
jgi:ATP-dependent RNA helicase DHX37/DHR1